MRCINATQDCSGRKAAFHRADKTLRALGEGKGEEWLKAALRVELIRYGVNWGVGERDISMDELERTVREVEEVEDRDTRMVLLKAECLLVYRKVFAFSNWEKYWKVSQVAAKVLEEINGSK